MTTHRKLHRWALAVPWVVCALAPAAWAQSRGELLYATHCVSCHSVQMHWREQRVATDWATLTAQVRRWQGAASLAWSEYDIQDVVRYLNGAIYHFAPDAEPSRAQNGSVRSDGQTLYAQLAPRALRSLSAVPLYYVDRVAASAPTALNPSPAASGVRLPTNKPTPKPNPTSAGDAARPAPIKDEAVRCETELTREARQQCLDKLARDSIDR